MNNEEKLKKIESILKCICCSYNKCDFCPFLIKGKCFFNTEFQEYPSEFDVETFKLK